MIDWMNLAANALWIVGCALALATMSWASWQAAEAKEKLRTRLGQPAPQAFLNLAGLLFSAGLAATSDVTWEKALWAVLAVLFLVQLVWTVRQALTPPAPADRSSENPPV